MGLIGAAVVGSAGFLAYKKIKKSRQEKRTAKQQQGYPQEQYDSYRDLAYGDLPEKSRDLDAKPRGSKSEYNSGSNYYDNNNNYHDSYNSNQNSYGYQNQQPRSLTFQPASEKSRGQHMYLDQPDTQYRQSQQQFYTGNDRSDYYNAPRQASYSRSSPAPRYQSGFVEEIDNESVRR